MRNIIPIIFYGNLFYGLCAVALCIESNLQHRLPLNGPHFYFLVFAVTVLYYSRIYYFSRANGSDNPRTLWYSSNQGFIKAVLLIIVCSIIIDAIIAAVKFEKSVIEMPLMHWVLLLVFPTIALLYTYKMVPFLRNKQLRGIGWLKPFFIGFAWSGIVTIYPVFFRQMQSGISNVNFTWPSGLFWLQNFLFITALAIIFDIKDEVADTKFQLKTYPALLGIKSAIRLIIIPLALLSLGALFLHQWQHHSTTLQITFQTIPYILLLGITTSLQKHRGILFYLVLVDGLMLLKGLCGIISILFL